MFDQIVAVYINGTKGTLLFILRSAFQNIASIIVTNCNCVIVLKRRSNSIIFLQMLDLSLSYDIKASLIVDKNIIALLYAVICEATLFG